MGIDRKKLVSRHDPEHTKLDPYAPLSVGNGEFAFTADVTGLQSILSREEGTTPLCTMAQWSWHSYPRDRSLFPPLQARKFRVAGRDVPYMTDSRDQEALFNELRINPHKFNLARLGFVSVGKSGSYTELEPDQITSVHQHLSLWEGLLDSCFSIDGYRYEVGTVTHPNRDLLSFRVHTPVSGKLAVLLAFPYASHEDNASDWTAPEKHGTELLSGADPLVLRLKRNMDDRVYYVFLRTNGKAERIGLHEFLLHPSGEYMEVSVEFSPCPSQEEVPPWKTCAAAAAIHWAQFWETGGMVELAESTDKRALELERRVILSQYLSALQCSGSYPPQETGLTCNSWYGKFHLEMHYWHAAHFPLWGRPELLARSLKWYSEVLAVAKEKASSQGYGGARWPKMTDPSGEDSPSPIGPFLCWQQPHPIMYAELLRRTGALGDQINEYGELVFESAQFMADYVQLEESSGRYVLGPPLIPAQEAHKPMATLNPSFELEYWRWALETALTWQEYFGSKAAGTCEKWKHVLGHLAAPPTLRLSNGAQVYPAHEHCPDTFESYGVDHPSMLLAMGMLPGASIDRTIMSSTYDQVLAHWDFESSWGWDFPAMAMTAARLGRRKDAVDALLMDTPKNTYRANGHNAQLSKPAGTTDAHTQVWKSHLPLYLPGNGALLLAVGMMAAGWDGYEDSVGAGGAINSGGISTSTPGFPDDGSWLVRVERISRMP